MEEGFAGVRGWGGGRSSAPVGGPVELVAEIRGRPGGECGSAWEGGGWVVKGLKDSCPGGPLALTPCL